MFYSELIDTNQGFQASVNLELDLNRKDKIKGYIPTQQSVKVLGELLRSYYYSTESQNRARVLIGPYLYDGLAKLKDKLSGEGKEEAKIIKAAADDSYRLFRKLGKSLGIIIPNTGAGTRFSLSEEVIEFLVLSIIPPKHMITLNEFVDLLYEHFGMVIGSAQYKKEMDKGALSYVSDLSFMEENKQAFAQKLKECGFLRDLSDATSIVENPYEREDDVV